MSIGGYLFPNLTEIGDLDFFIFCRGKTSEWGGWRVIIGIDGPLHSFVHFQPL